MTDYSRYNPIVDQEALSAFQGFQEPSGQSYYGDMPAGYPGTLEGMGRFLAEPGVNVSGVTPEKWTITVPATVDNSSDYAITISSADLAQVEIKITTDADATQAELTTALLNALKQDPDAYGAFKITEAANVITLEGKEIYSNYTIEAVDGALTNTLTVAKTASTTSDLSLRIIPFGRFVVTYPGYYIDPKSGIAQMSLPNTATDATLRGVTLASHDTEKVGIGQQAKEGYRFGTVMNVVYNVLGKRLMRVETVEDNITFSDTLYVDATTGKLTKTATNNIAFPASSPVSLIVPTTKTFGDRNITGIYFDKLR